MDSRSRELLELKAGVLQAMAHPVRLAILEVLRGRERCVHEIAGRVGAKRSNVSRHLSVMLGAGILGSRKKGLRVFYSLKTPCILDALGCVTRMLRQQRDRRSAVLQKL
jgi:ArsR family transcriptional regulator